MAECTSRVEARHAVLTVQSGVCMRTDDTKRVAIDKAVLQCKAVTRVTCWFFSPCLQQHNAAVADVI